jgi:hypothetical protein
MNPCHFFCLCFSEGCGTVTVRAWQEEPLFEDDEDQPEEEADNMEEVFDKTETDLLNASMFSTGTLVSCQIGVACLLHTVLEIGYSLYLLEVSSSGLFLRSFLHAHLLPFSPWG